MRLTQERAVTLDGLVEEAQMRDARCAVDARAFRLN